RDLGSEIDRQKTVVENRNSTVSEDRSIGQMQQNIQANAQDSYGYVSKYNNDNYNYNGDYNYNYNYNYGYNYDYNYNYNYNYNYDSNYQYDNPSAYSYQR